MQIVPLSRTPGLETIGASENEVGDGKAADQLCECGHPRNKHEDEGCSVCINEDCDVCQCKAFKVKQAGGEQ
jgi:hypothetical protein